MSGDSGINEYENVSGGWVGVKIKDDSRRTGFRGSAVAPNGRVMLSEEERVATANAPRRPEDNPFANGHLRLIAKDQETSHARPIGDGEPQPPQEQPEPATPERQEEPPAKPESEMTQEEIDDHNAKAAKARAVPGAEVPASPPPTAETTAKEGEKPAAAAAPVETVATPEAVTAAGEKPKGERDATETVGTPQAVKK